MPHPGPDSVQGLFAPENLSNSDTGFSATESRQVAWEPPFLKGAELGVGFSESFKSGSGYMAVFPFRKWTFR